MMRGKKLLAFLLAFVVLVGTMPMTALPADAAEEDYVTVTFDPNGGSFPMTPSGDSEPITIRVPRGSLLRRPYTAQAGLVYGYDNTPPTPARNDLPPNGQIVHSGGWNFSRWTTLEEYEANNTQVPASAPLPANFFQGNTQYSTADKTADKDLYLIAVWTYGEQEAIIQMGYGRVEFYDGNTLYPEYSYSMSETCRAIVEPDPAPEKEGYTFGGWNVREGSSAIEVKNGNTVVKTYAAGERFTDFGLVVPNRFTYVYKFEAVWELYTDTVKVRKVDQYGTAMEGVEFSLTYSYAVGTGGKVGREKITCVTDESGEFVIDPAALPVPADSTLLTDFILRESVPKGYEAETIVFNGKFQAEKDGTYRVMIEGAEPDGDTQVLTVENHKVEHDTTVTVRKYDQYGELLPGIRFHLNIYITKPMDGGKTGWHTVDIVYTTDENGEFEITMDGINEAIAEAYADPNGYWQTFGLTEGREFPNYLCLTEEFPEGGGYLATAQSQFTGRFEDTNITGDAPVYEINIPDARKDENGRMVLTVENVAADLTLHNEVYGIDAEDFPQGAEYTAVPREGSYEGEAPPTLSVTYDAFTDDTYVFKGPIPFADYFVKETYDTVKLEGYTLFVDYRTIPTIVPPTPSDDRKGPASEKVEEIERPGEAIIIDPIPFDPIPFDPIPDDSEDNHNYGVTSVVNRWNRGDVTVTNIYLRDLGIVKLVKTVSGLPEGTDVPADAVFKLPDENGDPVEFLVVNDLEILGTEEAADLQPVTEVRYGDFVTDEETGEKSCMLIVPTGTYTLEETGAEVEGYAHEMAYSPEITVEKAFEFYPDDYMTGDELNVYFETGTFERDFFKEIFRPLLLVRKLTPKPFDGFEPVYPPVVKELREAETAAPADPGDAVEVPDEEGDLVPDALVVTVENKYTEIEMIPLTVTKVWDDGDDKDGKRPDSVEVRIVADPGPYAGDTVILTAKENWTATVKVPETTTDGKTIAYSVEEADVDEYTSEVSGSLEDGFVITNTYEPEPEVKTISLTITKFWDDEDDKDGKRPDSVEVRIIADPGPYAKDTVILTAKENWTATVEVPETTEDGKTISYSVEEAEVDGYTSEVTGNVKDGFTVTNTYEPEIPVTGDGVNGALYMGFAALAVFAAAFLLMFRRKRG